MNIFPHEFIESIELGRPIPDNTKIIGTTVIRHQNMKKLPNNLHIEGSLNMLDCCSIEELPTGIEIKGNFDIWGCTALKSLPYDLKVEKNLTLVGCTSLILDKGIPPGVLGKVQIGTETMRNNRDDLIIMTNVNFTDYTKESYVNMLRGDI